MDGYSAGVWVDPAALSGWLLVQPTCQDEGRHMAAIPAPGGAVDAVMWVRITPEWDLAGLPEAGDREPGWFMEGCGL